MIYAIDNNGISINLTTIVNLIKVNYNLDISLNQLIINAKLLNYTIKL